MTKIYIDENLSPYIARGLDILEGPTRQGFEVISIADAFGRGAKDEEWIPIVGSQNGIVITQDYNIHRNKAQRVLFEKHGVGMFFFRPPKGYTYWEYVEQIVKRWQDIKKKSQNARPFAFKCQPTDREFKGM